LANKGIHTSPETAGIQNMPPNYADTHKDDCNTMQGLMPIWNRGNINKQYKGLWTEELLEAEINEFFNYCFSNEIKPAKVGLALWLAISKSTYWEWENKVTDYKSNLIQRASQIIELSYVGRAEKYPTANIFLLKSSHGHVETSRLDVVATNEQMQTDEVQDRIAQLGLDKPK
jgi:hypothetical protein